MSRASQPKGRRDRAIGLLTPRSPGLGVKSTAGAYRHRLRGDRECREALATRSPARFGGRAWVTRSRWMTAASGASMSADLLSSLLIALSSLKARGRASTYSTLLIYEARPGFRPSRRQSDGACGGAASGIGPATSTFKKKPASLSCYGGLRKRSTLQQPSRPSFTHSRSRANHRRWRG